MAIKELLVYLNVGENRQTRLDIALRLAGEYDAHITGLYVVPNTLVPSYASVHMPAEIIARQEAAIESSAKEVEKQFHASLANSGCTGEWVFARDFSDRQINRRARYADLILMPQADDESILSASASVDYGVVMGAGRPVLFIPREFDVNSTLGRSVLLAWDGSREAARALKDAMPILERAARVLVLSVNPTPEAGEVATAEICHYLARHRVNAIGDQEMTSVETIGERILAKAKEQGCDLMVMGAYGHSRLFETFLGGVTRTVFSQMHVPVLMSH